MPAALAVALLALLFQALIPPGYMLAATPGRSPAVVICTGHGPLRLDAPADRHAPPKQKAAAVCIFAGHGSSPVPTMAPTPSEIHWSRPISSRALPRREVFVGRGLAAPPPARGPPSVLV